MERFEIVVTTLFGIEALTAKEIRKLGYETTKVEDGRVTFLGDFEAVARANLWLRTGERVFIKIGEFFAYSFDELFDRCKELNWAHWIPKDAAFPVKGFTLKSTVYSVSDCQSIIKKSIVESLKKSYHTDWFPETGETYQLEFSIIRDQVTLMLDTSGDGLHKRGYRKQSNKAPLRETIAAALIMLSRFSYNGVLADPFCGSGTLPIEGALIAKSMAPGMNRDFAFQRYQQMSKKFLADAKEEALEELRDTKLRILASDIDPACVELTIQNSKIAGVSKLIRVTQNPVADFTCEEAAGTMVCNPPYGERMMELKESEQVLRQLGRAYKKLNNWALFAITPNEGFEGLIGRRADKKRKVYNGMIKCNIYQYFSIR